jgi:hypothetical protein
VEHISTAAALRHATSGASPAQRQSLPTGMHTAKCSCPPHTLPRRGMIVARASRCGREPRRLMLGADTPAVTGVRHSRRRQRPRRWGAPNELTERELSRSRRPSSVPTLSAAQAPRYALPHVRATANLSRVWHGRSMCTDRSCAEIGRALRALVLRSGEGEEIRPAGRKKGQGRTSVRGVMFVPTRNDSLVSNSRAHGEEDLHVWDECRAPRTIMKVCIISPRIYMTIV